MKYVSGMWVVPIILLMVTAIIVIAGASGVSLAWGAENISIYLSGTCQDTRCMTYCDIRHLDNSTEYVSGEINLHDSCKREPSPYGQRYWNYYEFQQVDSVIEIDSNYGSARDRKVITISPDYHYQYVLFSVNTTAYTTYHEYSSTTKCSTATVANDVSIINATIHYLLGNCQDESLLGFNWNSTLKKSQSFNIITGDAANFERCIQDAADKTKCSKYLYDDY